jgi:hypothetical protein
MASRQRREADRERGAERLSLSEAARLKPNSWSSIEVRMVDLSRLGFRAECDARLQPGSCVTLEVPGIGIVEAQVEWHRGSEFGARFLLPIELEGCGWTLTERQHALARLLVDRAKAFRNGREAAEGQLRRQILSALPIRKGSAAV